MPVNDSKTLAFSSFRNVNDKKQKCAENVGEVSKVSSWDSVSLM